MSGWTRGCAVVAVLALSGCKDQLPNRMNTDVPPTVKTVDASYTEYKQQLAQSCPAKHKDMLSPQDFNLETRKWYTTLDQEERQITDKNVTKACANNAAQPDCYNTGVLQGVIQDGKMAAFITQVCGPK